jgi:hypothetical protein
MNETPRFEKIDNSKFHLAVSQVQRGFNLKKGKVLQISFRITAPV